MLTKVSSDIFYSKKRIYTFTKYLKIKAGTINWNDINWQAQYSSIKAYYQTKLANILFTKELARRVKGILKCIDLFAFQNDKQNSTY